MYRDQLASIPVNVKNVLLKILCKRGYIKNPSVLKQLINPRVIEMDLSECEVSNDLLSCLHSCNYLTKLDLSLRRRQTRQITSQALISLLQHCKLLKIIAIPHCKELNDAVIETICQNCKYLEELHIPNSSITDKSLCMISQNLHNLSVINISGSQISDAGIQSLIHGPLSESLTEINIDKCQNISPYSGIFIFEKCINIKIFTCGLCGSYEEADGAMNGIRLKAKQISWRI